MLFVYGADWPRAEQRGCQEFCNLGGMGGGVEAKSYDIWIWDYKGVLP